MKKVRGRPKLGSPDANLQRAWQPKRWRPEYERMVLLSATGVSNTVLAQQFNYTPVHVSNILSTEQAKKIKDEIIANFKEESKKSVQSMLESISVKTVERLHTLMHDDAMFSQVPIQAIDRGFRVMEHLGTLKTKNEIVSQTNIGKVVIMPAEAAQALLGALDESKEVARLYPGE